MAWLPLESNPDVMTKYLHKMGVPENCEVTDVYGFDPELLALVPRPVYAVLLLFPYSSKHHEFKKEEEERLRNANQTPPKSLFYMKQIVDNACGTVALVHGIANCLDLFKLQDGILKDFLEKSTSLDAQKRGELLDEMHSLADLHKDIALEGQTEAPPPDEEVIHHFIAFVHKEGSLFELDGRKFGPINHGPTSPDTLLEDAAKVCKKFMERDPNEVRFTVVAITAGA